MRTRRTRIGFFILTHILVITLGFLVGVRFASGLTFRQLVGLSGQTSFAQLARVRSVQAPSQYSAVDFSLFWEVWSRLERDYLNAGDMDAQKMVYGAIAGMTSAVGDPYTVFLPPQNKQRLTEDLQGEFGGVGIELGYKEGQLAVISPLKDHPAEAAGVKAGDFILKIVDPATNTDKETINLSTEEAVNLIRGKTGTKVKITFLTPGEQPRELELTRATIEIPSLETKVLEKNGKKYLHVEISRFGDKTMQEWEDAVSQIQQQRMAGIVLDMRNNPGGYLQDAIDLSSDLIDGGVIVSQQGRNSTQSYKVTRRARLANVPVVVLVNKGSASASEIVAGALKDRRSAKLLGEQTFGKGTVQDAQQLPDGSGLNITIGRWLLPSGSSIHHTGLPVDIEVVDDANTPEDETVQKALSVLQE